jgi:hypothetical protein
VKRYLLFAGYYDYPSGGWNDFKGTYATPEEARADLATMGVRGTLDTDWAHIVDSETLTVVDVYRCGRYCGKPQRWSSHAQA